MLGFLFIKLAYHKNVRMIKTLFYS